MLDGKICWNKDKLGMTLSLGSFSQNWLRNISKFQVLCRILESNSLQGLWYSLCNFSIAPNVYHVCGKRYLGSKEVLWAVFCLFLSISRAMSILSFLHNFFFFAKSRKLMQAFHEASCGFKGFLYAEKQFSLLVLPSSTFFSGWHSQIGKQVQKSSRASSLWSCSFLFKGHQYHGCHSLMFPSINL